LPFPIGIANFLAIAVIAKLSKRAAKPARRASERRDHAHIPASTAKCLRPTKVAPQIDALEKRQDARFQAVFEAMRQWVKTPIRGKKRIGFHTKIELPAKSLDPVRNKRKY
jgi:hypothetical protein